MSGGLFGWVAALVFVPIAGAAFGMGFWTSAVLYMAVSLIAVPVDWTGGRVALLRIGGMEKILFCFMLAVVATLATGIEGTRDRDDRKMASPARHAPFLSALMGKSGADGTSDGTSSRRMEERSRKRRARLYRSAVTSARDCDRAHRQAVGALGGDNGRDKGVSQGMRRAAVDAAMHCERSWISFNGLDPIETVVEDRKEKEAEQLRACNEGYLGRWQANDDLLYAMDRGLSAREAKRIEAMNRQSEARIAGCAGFLRDVRQAARRGRDYGVL